MPKYLFETSFTPDGVKGVVAAGGSARVKAATETAKSLGGSIESYYFAFGSTDVYVIVELPDNAAAAALALTVAASGAATVRTTVLLSPAEVDDAAKRQVSYRPPGQ